MKQFYKGESRAPAGFRLDRLELWNWGTFHGGAQFLEPHGGWTLLIGDNGSGKSTAIDALRTLLVPPRILNYNDAAADTRRGATRDRTRRSYIRGAWSSSSTVDSTAATTQYLRNPGTLSAIAAIFIDPLRSSAVTIAQVLWEQDEQVRDFFALCAGRKGLADLIAGGLTSTEIRRSARTAGWEVHDNFAAYGERLRALLHIPGDKALEVFNRAIGMKEVGDIDAFVRQFMLPSAETFAFIRDTVQPHYRTLLDCWLAIERAERQVMLLRPIAEHWESISRGEARIDAWTRLQRLMSPLFATIHLELLRESEAELLGKVTFVNVTRAELVDQVAKWGDERDGVRARINSSEVGSRLELLDREIASAEGRLRAALHRREHIQTSAEMLGVLTALENAAAFAASRAEFERHFVDESAAANEADSRRAAFKFAQEQALRVRLDAQEELESVERNRVNIPRNYLLIRNAVADAANVAQDQMPFAGELIEVLEGYAEWTGAIERLLRPFALSLLVPEHVHRRAASYINVTHLGLRLVFHPVPHAAIAPPALSKETVPGRLKYRAEHPFHLWVANEVVRRFAHRCCANVAELESADFGITAEGLIREPRRYVKDDARSVHDVGARILGWSTDAKIAALRIRASDADSEAASHGKRARAASEAAALSRARAAAARDLTAVFEFSDIAPDTWSAEIVRLKAERAVLEGASAEITALNGRLNELSSKIKDGGEQLSSIDRELGLLHGLIDSRRHDIALSTAELAGAAGYDHPETEMEFSTLAFPIPATSLEDIERQKHDVLLRLQGMVNEEQRRVKTATGKATAAMRVFLERFPEFGQSLQSEVAFSQDFVAILRRVEGDELPEHRARFELYLNENLVGDLQMLHHRLEQHQDAIETRTTEINAALQQIAYSDETYVQLRIAARPNTEVAEFRRHLRSCFDFAISPTREDQLQIFERVRVLVERFAQEPEATQRVTDVRNWLASGVQELNRADDREVNYYSATTGKSGGQKAKLAFTILASALAAQYGLSAAQPDSENFRLVVIDEAFSRTDETNSTQAMELFARLGFQLLIVGPFDAKAKLAIPFVKTVHLASNPGGNASSLSVLSRAGLETMPLAAD